MAPPAREAHADVKRDASWCAPISAQQAPRALSRAGRCKLLAEAAQALLAGKLPSREAQLFLGGAISAWLAQGGKLERYLQVHQRGSHLTPQRLIADEREKSEDGESFEASESETDKE